MPLLAPLASRRIVPLAGSFARQIDIAMDDGLPASGTVRLLASGASSGTAITPAELNDGGLYTVCAAY